MPEFSSFWQWAGWAAMLLAVLVTAQEMWAAHCNTRGRK
jgi:hypothetical protein